MTDAKSGMQRLASYLSSEIHGEDEGLEIYGTSATGDMVYIEGDIDGEEFTAEIMVMRFSLVDDDDDLDDDEGDDE